MRIKRDFLFLILAFVSAVFMALLEIQVEGSMGWAANLPTWRKTLPISVFGMFGYEKKPLTGYHLYLWLLLFVLPHFAFLFTSWDLKKEFYLLSFYTLFTTLEGILWFILNPAYGFKRFNPENVNWYHEVWVLGTPIEYWFRFLVGFIFYYLSYSDRLWRFLKKRRILFGRW